MLRLFCLTAIVSILMFGTVGCEKSDPNVLTVSARVEFEVQPDAAVVSIELGERASTRDDVLRQTVQKHKNLREDLENHDGIESIKFEAKSVGIRPIATAECARSLLGKMGEYADMDDINEAYDLCPETDFYASMYIQVTVMPPEASGIVLSYATLNQAASADLDEFIIVDVQKARQNAKSAAAGKIRSIASDIADQSGVNLGALKKLSFRGDSHFSDFGDDSDEVIVTGSRIKVVSEEVRLEIDPQLITISETVTATFEISE